MFGSWVKPEYRFFVKDNNEKLLVSLEIDPSKRLADINQENNIFIA